MPLRIPHAPGLGCLTLLLALPLACPSAFPATIEDSVVRVFATQRIPDVLRPWTKQAPREGTGSGVVIEGNRILTNAHVVLYASQVQVQGSQAGDKLSATVIAVAPGIDLAVLKIDDDAFFAAHPALERAPGLPKVQDPVTVYGFPTGGTALSITKGIVSRIDFVGYSFPVSGLRVQIDAAINPGNSGGPALVDNKVIGLAFSTLANTQNIGYIIPSEEIELFLKDVADGRYDGKPAIYDEFQSLQNSALRAFLKVDKSVQGVVVREPFQPNKDSPLKPWDIVTKIGGTPIDDQGGVLLGTNSKVRFNYLAQKVAKDGKVPLTIVRAGKEMTVQLPVPNGRAKLIPYLQGAYPPYFILGPVVFSIATEDTLAAIGTTPSGPSVNQSLNATGSPLSTRRGDGPAFPGEELVMISSPFFAHALAKNYDNPTLRIVESLNGTPLRNLRHLVELVRDSKDEFLAFRLAGHGGESLVFPRAEILAATDGILTDNGIRDQGSADLLAVWNTKRP